jgi:chromosome segregation ATPase
VVLSEDEFLQALENYKNKLIRAQRQIAGLKEKAKYLEMHYNDAKLREENTTDLVTALLERQRELNVMLNRANIMLNRTQETMALTSMEFNEMAKALPEPKKAEWSDRVQRINELFKKTGVQDAEMVGPESSSQPEVPPLETDEMKKQSEEAFQKRESMWERTEQRKPPRIEAEAVEEEPVKARAASAIALEQDAPNQPDARDLSEGERLLFPPRRKSWWQKAAS